MAPNLAYPDCARTDDCACAKRGYPKPHRIGCLIPCIKELAARLGWRDPYPDAGSDEAKFLNLLSDLELAIREGRDAALAGDMAGAKAAMGRAADYLAIMRRREAERFHFALTGEQPTRS